MKRVDGSADHTHTITEFSAEKAFIDIVPGSLNVLEGTSTVSTREGPIADVTTRIAFFNNSRILIAVDPADTKLSNHFGDDAINGTIT